MARVPRFVLPRWLIVLGLLVGGVFLLRGRGDGMFFSPDFSVHGTPESYRLEVEKVRFAAPGGPVLSGWVAAARNPRGTIVYCHGDSANLTHHARYVSWMPDRGYTVLLFDYRGYGASLGDPTREGVVADTLAAIDFALERDPTHTIVYGHGLGAAVGIVAAAQRPAVRGVVAEAVFPSYRSAAQASVPPLQPIIPWLVSRGLDPIDAVRRLPPRPLLVVHGDQDEVIPMKLGRELFEAALQPKQFYVAERCGHESPFVKQGDAYIEALSTFLNDALRR